MRTREEEILNAWTHLASCVISVGFAVYALGSTQISLYNKLAFVPMLGSTIWTFFASYIYHIEEDEEKKERNRSVDKAAIFGMIMGCGVSCCLTVQNSQVAVWSSVSLILVSGIFTGLYCLSRNFPEWLSLVVYIVVGWIAVFPALGLFGDSLYTQRQTVVFLIVTGSLYCIGILFYSQDHKKWNHTIWHIFVMAAAAVHMTGHLFSITVR